MAVLQAHPRAPGQHQRVVAVLVRAAVAAAIENERVVQQRAIALGRLVQPLEEIPELLGQELVEPTQPPTPRTTGASVNTRYLPVPAERRAVPWFGSGGYRR